MSARKGKIYEVIVIEQADPGMLMKRECHYYPLMSSLRCKTWHENENDLVWISK